jgi:DNA repair exonuclease SbcCD ATPase subunit
MSYETLASREYLAEKQAALNAAAEKTKVAYRAALASQEERNRLKDEAEKAEAELPKLREAIRQAEGRKADGSSAAAAAGAREESLKAQLIHADRDEAGRRMRQLSEEEKGISDAVRRHEAAFEEAEKRYADARGQLTAREDQRKALKESLARAEEHLSGVLSDLHFPDEAAVLAALPPVREDRQERWLKDERRAITEYENDCTNTAGRIRELAEALAGKERTDLEALSEEIDAAGELLARKNEEKNRKSLLVTNHQMTLKRVRAHKNYLDRTEEAFKRVNRLGSLAEGEKSEGGKISFDRYVIGAVFREILQMANRRLDIMSGGKYRLIYKSGVKRTNSEAGLEISVLDLSTGRERDSNSLSGGESFFTSLALAIGLSDVVQNHAGGRRLETLFVDEGFGTLSDDVLDLALSVLKSLSEGNRMVGLISHVDKLNESIPQKIHVKNGKRGSTVRVETA